MSEVSTEVMVLGRAFSLATEDDFSATRLVIYVSRWLVKRLLRNQIQGSSLTHGVERKDRNSRVASLCMQLGSILGNCLEY